ncbi:MAG: hypothetical protein WDM91_08710 [Rhizomicrobium sp.]
MGLHRRGTTLSKLDIGATIHGMMHQSTGTEWVGADGSVHTILTALVFTEVKRTIFDRQAVRFGKINIGFRNGAAHRPPRPGLAFRAKIAAPLSGGHAPYRAKPSTIFTLANIEVGQPIPEYYFDQGYPRLSNSPEVNLPLKLLGRLDQPFRTPPKDDLDAHWNRQGFWFHEGVLRGVQTKPTETSMFILSESGMYFYYKTIDDLHAIARSECETVRDFDDGWMVLGGELGDYGKPLEEDHCMTMWAHARLYRLLTVGWEPPPHRRQEAIQLANDLRAKYAREGTSIRPFAPPTKPANNMQKYYLQFHRQRLGRIRAIPTEPR